MLVVLALLLALMTFGKVLSPQYFIWILPAWALVAARDRWIAVLGGLTLALTQAEFPALYWNLLDMETAPLAIVVTRNTLLLATFAVALWRVWRLPETAPAPWRTTGDREGADPLERASATPMLRSQASRRRKASPAGSLNLEPPRIQRIPSTSVVLSPSAIVCVATAPSRLGSRKATSRSR